MKLVEDMLSGHRLSLARLISKVENRDSDLNSVMTQVFPHTGRAQVWGITGPPGAGKSTLVDQMITRLRVKGKRVAVIAIDPSSPFTGGAILGDRIRMQNHSEDPDVYIRSLGTRGKHGGLSYSTKEVVLLLDAAGFDMVLVETAGVGQTELDILRLAQTILVVLVPESGDSVQVMKAGLMEIADLFAVNKCDRPEADSLIRELKSMIGLTSGMSGEKEEDLWTVPVHKTDGIRGIGMDELLTTIENHQEYLTRSGKRVSQIRNFLKNEVFDILSERLSDSVFAAFETSSGKELLDQLVKREIDPYQAASLLSGF